MHVWLVTYEMFLNNDRNPDTMVVGIYQYCDEAIEALKNFHNEHNEHNEDYLPNAVFNKSREFIMYHFGGGKTGYVEKMPVL